MKKFAALILSLFVFSILSPNALALSTAKGSDPTGQSQRNIIEKTPWLDPTACKSAVTVPDTVNVDSSCMGVYYPGVVLGQEAAFEAALLAYIKQERSASPMATAEIAGLLVKYGKMWNVNPMLLIAMAYQESAFCTDGRGCTTTTNRNPWGNLTSSGALVQYASWEASVNGFANNVGVNHVRHLLATGGVTLAREIAYHCGAPDIFTVVPRCDGPGYYEKTVARMTAMIALAGSALACSVAGGSPPTVNTSDLQPEICVDTSAPGGVGAGDGTCAAIPNNPVQIAINCSWPTQVKYVAVDGYMNLLAAMGTTSPNNGMDCGTFVATVMRASGADPNYPKVGTYDQEPYVRDHPEKYKIFESVTSTAELLPGDILIVNKGTGAGADGHTYIYVGPNSKGGPAASASLGTRYPGLGAAILSDSRGSYMVARLIK